jgi:hypothetical protein
MILYIIKCMKLYECYSNYKHMMKCWVEIIYRVSCDWLQKSKIKNFEVNRPKIVFVEMHLSFGYPSHTYMFFVKEDFLISVGLYDVMYMYYITY